MAIIYQSLSRKTYEVVRQRILTGDMAPNTPVRQDAIADELGVSTIPIREALSRLEQDGLVSSYPNRGYIVRPLSAAEAAEVYAMRLKLEPDAVSAAALKATEQDHAIASEALAALEATPSHGMPSDHVTANRLFHIALIRPGAGLVTLQILDRLHVVAERYVRVHLQPLGRDARARREHEDMLSAWIARDASTVQRLVFEHISETIGDLEKQLQG